jgi:hypothetical protein
VEGSPTLMMTHSAALCAYPDAYHSKDAKSMELFAKDVLPATR